MPWGFNYDHDAGQRLIEEYWDDEWPTVVEDFQEMKGLGANVVRVHLQVGAFMNSPTEPNDTALKQLARLVRLAEQTGLYLDVTGLGCYRKGKVPEWYSSLDEAARWDVQARFWEAVASVCAPSPAIFCYDLMNEPVVTEDKEKRDWLPGEALGEFHFVQRITVDLAGRSREQVAEAWVNKLAGAIRSRDKRHLITVGAIPWAHVWPNAKPLFYSPQVSRNLDFVSVHFYPKSGEIDKALAALAVYDIGKPIVIEEMFPLSCSADELGEFIQRSSSLATGWIGFYWGKSIEEYEASKRGIGEEMTLGWLRLFQQGPPKGVR